MTIMDNISLIEGDITKACVDAIVNAANPIMLGGGGVDGAIHRAAGPELRELCLKVKTSGSVRCPTGDARITTAANLTAKYVIHTVGPRYQYENHPAQLLTRAYQSSLDLALNRDCESIAFPAISCGVYGYPAQEAAEISASVCCNEEYRNLHIYFYLFNQKLLNIWQAAFNQ
jgi:O-acetyl-ADP-ribose deacetylase